MGLKVSKFYHFRSSKNMFLQDSNVSMVGLTMMSRLNVTNFSKRKSPGDQRTKNASPYFRPAINVLSRGRTWPLYQTRKRTFFFIHYWVDSLMFGLEEKNCMMGIGYGWMELNFLTRTGRLENQIIHQIMEQG